MSIYSGEYNVSKAIVCGDAVYCAHIPKEGNKYFTTAKDAQQHCENHKDGHETN